MNTQTDACIHAKTPAHTVDSQTHPENFELAHTQYSEDLSSFIPAFMLNREQTWSLCGVCVCVWQDKKCWGRQRRAWERTNCCTDVSLGEKMSEVPRRSGDTCTSLPSSRLCFPIPPHLTASSSTLFLSFHPAQSAALWPF